MIIALNGNKKTHRVLEDTFRQQGNIVNYIARSWENKYKIVHVSPYIDSKIVEASMYESEALHYSDALDLIQVALQYPPSIALAYCNAEETHASKLSFSRFVNAFAEDVTHHLDHVEEDGFHLKKVIRWDGELCLGQYYWVKIIDEEKCLWVSLDYQVYETQRTHFLGL